MKKEIDTNQINEDKQDHQINEATMKQRQESIRKDKLRKYKLKRKKQMESKNSYEYLARRKVAVTRPRVKGRFIPYE